MHDRELDWPDDRLIRFRIGINLGDVIAEGDDIFGDGVNVAARLEALAEPGGICISRTVRDQIRDKLPYQFGDLGEQSVKNIARPVRVYALRPEAIAELPVAKMSPPASISHAIVAPRLSIVVLPFANLNNDPDQQYFADGITEDVTTDLSRLAHMFVISRNTAFTYRNKPADTKQIGRELSVRYILEGSVRRSGNQVRVSVQLIDAATDAHLWAARFDRNTSDLFAVQDEITSRIAVALNLEMIGAEAARLTDHPDALDYILRARAAAQKPVTRSNYSERVSLYERALEFDPGFVEAQSWLASTLAGRVLDDMTESASADIARAESLVEKALRASPRSPLAHYAKGQLLRQQHRNEEAIPEYEMVIAFNRNWPQVYAHLGRSKFNTGHIEELIPLVEYAIALSPRDPDIHHWFSRIGLVHLLQSRIDDAIVWFEKARTANPEQSLHHSHLCSAYALKGDIERADGELAEARRVSGDGRYTSLARLKSVVDFGAPSLRALYEATYFAGLLKAGMPEE